MSIEFLLLGGLEGIKPDGARENLPRTLDRDTGRVESNLGMEINIDNLGGAAIVWHLEFFWV